MLDNIEYIYLLIIVGLLLVWRTRARPEQKATISRLVCFCLIFFAGFRYYVGTDYRGYTKMYLAILQEGRYYDIEWGYYWMVKFFGAIDGTPQIVFFVFSFATIYFIYKFIEHFSDNVELSWIIFLCIGPYFLSTFNGMRQWLATAMFAYSLRYVKEDNFKKYALLNAFGALFHYSTVILIPLYWVLKAKNFSLVKILATYVVFQFCAMLGIINFLAEKLHATSYLEGDAAFEMDWSYYIFLLMAVCFMLLHTVMPQITDDLCIFNNMNALSGLSVFLAFTTSGMSNMIFTRFNVFFFIGYIILVPAVLMRIKEPELKRLITFAVVALCIAYYFYITSTAEDLTPYTMKFMLFY